jgi:hypothetical protein
MGCRHHPGRPQRSPSGPGSSAWLLLREGPRVQRRMVSEMMVPVGPGRAGLPLGVLASLLGLVWWSKVSLANSFPQMTVCCCLILVSCWTPACFFLPRLAAS